MLSDVKTPYDIDQWEVDNILSLIQDELGSKVIPKKNRLEIIKILYKVMGFNLAPDAALCLASNVKEQLIISTAGSGKTTLSQLKAIFQKMILPAILGRPLYGYRLLCLVYNNHNVKQMENMHLKMLNKLYAAKIPGFPKDLSPDIKASTFHSFALQWIDEYKIEWGLEKATVLEDWESQEILELCVQSASKKHVIAEVPPMDSLLTCYNLGKELLLSYSDESLRERFPEIKMSNEALETVYKFYEMMKRRGNRYDWVDTLTFMKKLLEENEIARLRIQEQYDYIIADEVQDATPLMMLILKYISEKCPLLCIGDEDQALYEFKGADVENALNFSKFFPKGEVYVMATNRRCGKLIVDASAALIKRNKVRFNKKILHVREGGRIDGIPYGSEESMISNIISKLETMPKEKRDSTVLCYRERSCSYVLAERLEEAGVPFNILSGHAPFSHELYKHVESVLRILLNPTDRIQHLRLNRVLPITYNELVEVLGWDADENSFRDGKIKMHLKNVDFGRFSTRETFMRELQALLRMIDGIEREKMNSFFPELFEMICKYSWNYKLRDKPLKDMVMHETMTERVRLFYNSPLLCENFLNRLEVRRRNLGNQSKARVGVTLSTMHSLKGLEFDNCIMTHLDDAIFPSINSITYEQGKVEEAMEVERRLGFVAMTRARDHLMMYYPSRNPSIFISNLEEDGYLNTSSAETKNTNSMNVFLENAEVVAKPPANSVSSRLKDIFSNF